MTRALYTSNSQYLPEDKEFLADVEQYIGSLSFNDYYRIAETSFPFVLKLIDADRIQVRSLHKYVDLLNSISWEFEDQTSGGRGVAYNRAQKNFDNRRTGTLALLKCFSESETDLPSEESIILDALGGDGTITRITQNEKGICPTIISADISGFMVEACLKQKLPSIRQSASYSLFQDSVLDGVLLAYGAHHLDKIARKTASEEAYRQIKHGGKFVLHDFEIGSPVADWFNKVVHPYSRTGHPYPHFSRSEMFALLNGAGFKDIKVIDIWDPIELKGTSADDAYTKALHHLYDMYDLVKIEGSDSQKLEELSKLARSTLGEIQIKQMASEYKAIVPRTALVAIGTKVSSRRIN